VAGAITITSDATDAIERIGSQVVKIVAQESDIPLIALRRSSDVSRGRGRSSRACLYRFVKTSFTWGQSSVQFDFS
jgi:hypothetical protein